MAHIYNYEGGGIAFNSAVQVRTAGTPDGNMEVADMLACITNPHDVHAAPTRLLALENTNNKAGGTCLPLAQVEALTAAARGRGLGTHLDGARAWNALVALGHGPRPYGAAFDSISLCFSKGLGCPVGSVLTGSKDFIVQARRIRKRLGGGMRQAGYLAAAALYAMDHHISRLAEDHAHAKALANIIRQQPWAGTVVEPQTNILIFSLKEGLDEKLFLSKMREAGIHMLAMGPGRLRMVTHLDFRQEDLGRVSAALERLAL